MNLEELKQIIQSFIEEPIINFTIELQLFRSENGRKVFNQTIKSNVEKKYGVYIWVDTLTKEVLYIGMAGKIKTNGSLGDHSIQNRLLASRAKDKETGKDIQTNDYIFKFMNDNQINSLDFCVMYSKKEEPPAYIEAVLLYNYYKKNKKLPILNNSF